MNVIIGGVVSFYEKESVKIDELGKWTVFQLKKNNKMVAVIIIYQILNCSEQGVYKAITQYNKMKGQQKTVTIYWKQVFQVILDYCR